MGASYPAQENKDASAGESDGSERHGQTDPRGHSAISSPDRTCHMGGVRVSHRWLRRNALITAPRLATAAPNMNTRRVNETPLRAAPIRNQRVVPAAYPNQNGKQFEPPRPLIGHFSLP